MHIVMNQQIKEHTWKANEYSAKTLPWDLWGFPPPAKKNKKPQDKEPSLLSLSPIPFSLRHVALLSFS